MEYKLESDMEFGKNMTNEEIREALLNFKLVLVNFRGFINKNVSLSRGANNMAKEAKIDINNVILSLNVAFKKINDNNIYTEEGLEKLGRIQAEKIDSLSNRISALEKQNDSFFKRIFEKVVKFFMER